MDACRCHPDHIACIDVPGTQAVAGEAMSPPTHASGVRAEHPLSPLQYASVPWHMAAKLNILHVAQQHGREWEASQYASDTAVSHRMMHHFCELLLREPCLPCALLLEDLHHACFIREVRVLGHAHGEGIVSIWQSCHMRPSVAELTPPAGNVCCATAVNTKGLSNATIEAEVQRQGCGFRLHNHVYMCRGSFILSSAF